VISVILKMPIVCCDIFRGYHAAVFISTRVSTASVELSIGVG